MTEKNKDGFIPGQLVTFDQIAMQQRQLMREAVSGKKKQTLSEQIIKALSQLDQANNKHWTGSGLPSVKAVEEILGRDITRADINDAAPEFRREV